MIIVDFVVILNSVVGVNEVDICVGLNDISQDTPEKLFPLQRH